MSLVSKYFAEIGRRGGIRSRRILDPETARRMVEIREARRIARRAQSHSTGTPADTTISAQAVQDARWRRMSPSEKLALVARLSRMVDQLSREGIKLRHAEADEKTIRRLRAELRLGRPLARRVYDRHTHGA
jgi:acyl-CoA reductase-like NAD-dependent aldehyde dehydrogenase